MSVIYPFLALFAGLLFAVQGPVNTSLGRRSNKFFATAVSFGGGTLILLAVVLLSGSRGLAAIGCARFWQLLGGVYGAFGVCVSIAAIPVLGVALTLMTTLLGQLVMAVVVDCFGLFGQNVLPVSPLRVAGILAVAAGILLIYAANRKSEAARSRSSSGTLPLLLLAFASGLCGAVQSPTNASLAALVGQWESTLVSFSVGFVSIAFVTLLTGNFSVRTKGTGIRPWMVIGGAYGVLAIYLNLFTVSRLGATLQVTCGLLGQLIGGVAVDSLGLIETEKVRISPLRLAGILAVFLGVLLVTSATL